MRPLVLALVFALPQAALACGGLFCDAVQPVNQSAERILFSVHEGQTDMHVQISYQGPSNEFGWLVPVPRGVETGLSSQLLFTTLDNTIAPRFVLTTEFDGDCGFSRGSGSDAGAAGGGGAGGEGFEEEGGPQVQVLERGSLGPYDRAVLDADDVSVLRDWLDLHEFAIPESLDEKLVPYLEAGAVFVVLKLLPDAEAGDIAPLHLRFPGTAPSVPIIPTALAAEPDMGIIVHVLGQHRAIPKNYLHVQINEAAIDWQSAGMNYADVVSQAADEADGRAFTTDYAGAVPEQLGAALRPLSEDDLAKLRAAEVYDDLDWRLAGDADFQRIYFDEARPPEGVDPEDYQACPQCYIEIHTPVDGAALAHRWEEEVQPAREALTLAFDRSAYLTRLYTTLSPAEMDTDPVFAFNPDLKPVSNVHNAREVYPCVNGDVVWDGAVLVLADGTQAEGEPIRRQGGVTMRGQALTAAKSVEKLEEAGPAVVLREAPAGRPFTGFAGGVGNNFGCACDAGDAGPSAGFVALLLALGAFRLRSREA